MGEGDRDRNPYIKKQGTRTSGAGQGTWPMIYNNFNGKPDGTQSVKMLNHYIVHLKPGLPWWLRW